MPKRILQGKVVSTKCDKSAVVEVNRRVMHPIYRKFINRSRKFMAHDAENKCEVGQEVRIQECKPISKKKTWVVLESIN